MHVAICAYRDDDADPYVASRFHTDDLSVAFVDTAAGYVDAAGASSWAQSILTALGKLVDLPGSREHPSDDLNAVPIWLHAHHTRWVVLPDAHLISERIRGRVLAAVAAGGADLLLIARPRRLKETIEAFAGWNPDLIDWGDLHELLPHDDDRPGPNRTERLPLPTSDWTTFRWDARQTMTDDQFERFDRTYVAAYRTATRRMGPAHLRTVRSRAQTRRLLEETTDSMNSIDDMFIAMRAVQAAHFARGFNLRIQTRTILSNLSRASDAKLGDIEWTALRAFEDPIRAAVCALRASGTTTADLTGLTVGQARGRLDRTGTTDTVTRAEHGNGPAAGDESRYDGRQDAEPPLDPRAHPFVAAAVTHRLLAAVGNEAPLIPRPKSWISRCLNRTWADIGVPIGVGYGTAPHTRAGTWKYHDGFMIQGILG